MFSSARRLNCVQGLTMLADIRGANGRTADLLPEALRSNLPDR
jgi:hypothetical protein